MAGGLQYQTSMVMLYKDPEPGYSGSTGTVSWRNAALSGSYTASYWVYDTNYASLPGNCARLTVTVSGSWTASVTNRVYTVTLKSYLISVKNEKVGNGYTNTPYDHGRDVQIINNITGAVKWEKHHDCTDYGTYFNGKLEIGTQTFTLNPETSGGAGVYAIRMVNHSTGYDWTDPFTDSFKIGAQFRNTLEKDYRPGATLVSGTWKSHDRSGGACNILKPDKSWRTMRTYEGGVSSDHPPFILHSSGNKNQRKIGST